MRVVDPPGGEDEEPLHVPGSALAVGAAAVLLCAWSGFFKPHLLRSEERHPGLADWPKKQVA